MNFAFIGQFAETTRDCIFTTEYSVRTAMEATYQLLDLERGVPEVFNSTYDIRYLMKATTRLADGEAVHEEAVDVSPVDATLAGGPDGAFPGDVTHRRHAIQFHGFSSPMACVRDV